MEVSQAEFQKFKDLQVRKRWDWPATFSTNPSGVIWPFVTKGKTAYEDRVDVRNESLLLGEIADRYLAIRQEGGRFFIGWDGAFWKSTKGGEKQVIANWHDMSPKPLSMTIAEARELVKMKRGS